MTDDRATTGDGNATDHRATTDAALIGDPRTTDTGNPGDERRPGPRRGRGGGYRGRGGRYIRRPGGAGQQRVDRQNTQGSVNSGEDVIVSDTSSGAPAVAAPGEGRKSSRMSQSSGGFSRGSKKERTPKTERKRPGSKALKPGAEGKGHKRQSSKNSESTPNQLRGKDRAMNRRGMFVGSDYADRRHFSIIQEDPAALEKVRAEVGGVHLKTKGFGGKATRESENLDDLPSSGQRRPNGGGRCHDYRCQDARYQDGIMYHSSGSLGSATGRSALDAAYPGRRRWVHLQSADLFEFFSPVQKDRMNMVPTRPRAFLGRRTRLLETSVPNLVQLDAEDLAQHFPNIYGAAIVEIQDSSSPLSTPPADPLVTSPGSASPTSLSQGGTGGVTAHRSRAELDSPLSIGLVLSGGPAPGGHNVIAGVYDYIKSLNPESRLIGFKGGLDGLFRSEYIEIHDELMNRFRNTGGFDMIWSGRGKITDAEKPAVKELISELNLQGLIVVGGDGSNSNAALLAEYVAGADLPCSVVGVPKTIDGDLKNAAIECSFGFDTAAKTYSESIGNLCVDCSIGQGVWHFVRVMGRSASHLVLECAMQTRPNLVFIGEEVEKNHTSLKEIVTEIADLIEKRWNQGKPYGVVLVPEGLVGFIPEVKQLIADLGKIDPSKMKKNNSPPPLNNQGTNPTRADAKVPGGEIIAGSSPAVVSSKERIPSIAAVTAGAGGQPLGTTATVDGSTLGLEGESKELWDFLPGTIRDQLMNDREATGYIQEAKIATERLLILSVEDVLRQRGFPVKAWNRMHHYFGYEGRCAMPSNFDANYCYALGLTAGCLIQKRKNGYMAVVKNLSEHATHWQPIGVPFTNLMKMLDLPMGRIPGIIRQLVDLDSKAFHVFSAVREEWKHGDYYRCPGPIQFVGPVADISNYVVCPPDVDDLLAGCGEKLKALRLVGRAVTPKRLGCYSLLQRERLQYAPSTPMACQSLNCLFQRGIQHSPKDPYIRRQILIYCHSLCSNNEFYLQEIKAGDGGLAGDGCRSINGAQVEPLNVGVVFLSRQAPGMQNILWGAYVRTRMSGGRCLGFKGVEGLLSKDYIEITENDLELFKNQGGTDLLGRAIEHVLMVPEKREIVLRVVTELNLDGLVLVGSSLAMTEASYLAEFLLNSKAKCKVIGVPATASNNLGHDLIEANIGFDTASKLYSSLIGNVLTDAASMPKYWHFVRLMGRQPSNEVLECALQTHPNIVIVAEEYGAAQKTLQQVVQDIADVVVKRTESEGQCRNFGAVIIPDGLWHHLPTFRLMLSDVDRVISDAVRDGSDREAKEELLCDLPGVWTEALPPWSLAVWRSLPRYIREEFLTSDTELRLSFVETEMLLSEMVSAELKQRKKRGEYNGTFQCVCHYFGYQGRSAMPSVFDATLGFVHGHLAIMCLEANLTGHLTTIRGLCEKVENWKLGAVPFNCLLTLVPTQQDVSLHPQLLDRKESDMPVMPNAEINLSGKAFRWLKIARPSWEMQDRFCNPGPIQFWGAPSTFYHRILHEEQSEYSRMLRHTQRYAQMLKDACDFGVEEDFLKFAFTSLHGLLFLRHHQDSLVEDIGRIRPRHHDEIRDDDSISSDAEHGEAF